MRTSRHAGFSLVELLIVIAIFIILTAMILPMLSRSRERARQTECSRQLRQIGIAIFGYTADFEGNLPTRSASPTRNFEPLNTHNYISDGKVWSCPSRSVAVSTAAHSSYIYLASGWKDTSPTPETVSVAHDEYDNHSANEWSNVLYLDGHVDGGNPQRSLDFANEYPVINP